MEELPVVALVVVGRQLGVAVPVEVLDVLELEGDDLLALAAVEDGDLVPRASAAATVFGPRNPVPPRIRIFLPSPFARRSKFFVSGSFARRARRRRRRRNGPGIGVGSWSSGVPSEELGRDVREAITNAQPTAAGEL